MNGDKDFRRELRLRISGEILFDEPAGRHTSIGVGGPIDTLLFPEDERELVEVVRFLRERQVPFLPVGNWTNLIVRDGGFRGALISLARLCGLSLRENGEKGAGRMIEEQVRKILDTRRGKHPLAFRNAGSIFKNPRDIPAGRLIDECGLRGLRIGDAEVSEKHANFIVNRGQATAEQIIGLIELIQRRVFERTGHALETEVRIIGE